MKKKPWHTIVCYNKLAEICEKFLHKGSEIFIEGRIENRKYTDKEGIERFQTQIVGNEMKMMGSKKLANDVNGNVNYEPMQVDDDIPF